MNILHDKVYTFEDDPEFYDGMGLKQPDLPVLEARVTVTEHNASVCITDPDTRVGLADVYVEYYNGEVVVRAWGPEDLGNDPQVEVVLSNDPATDIEDYKGDYV